MWFLSSECMHTMHFFKLNGKERIRDHQPTEAEWEVCTNLLFRWVTYGMITQMDGHLKN
jgi:hypothetical protein